MSQEVKAYLSRYLHLCDEIDSKIEDVIRLRETAQKVTSVISGDRVQVTSSENKLENAVIKIVTMEEAISEDIDRLTETKKEIQKSIDSISDERYRLVLTYRYIVGLTWEEIAVKMKYTYRNVCYLHGKALQEIFLS